MVVIYNWDRKPSFVKHFCWLKVFLCDTKRQCYHGSQFKVVVSYVNIIVTCLLELQIRKNCPLYFLKAGFLRCNFRTVKFTLLKHALWCFFDKSTELFITTKIRIQGIYITSKSSLIPFCSWSPPAPSQATTNLTFTPVLLSLSWYVI